MFGRVYRHILDQKKVVRIETARFARFPNQRDG